MIKTSAETLWARRVLAADPVFSRLFEPVPMACEVAEAVAETHPVVECSLAEIFEFTSQQATVSELDLPPRKVRRG